MVDIRTVEVTPTQARFALGYACVCAWAVILLIAPVFEQPSSLHAAPASMLPGLITCLASLFSTTHLPSIPGRTGFVALSSFLMAAGTLLCTFPATASILPTRLIGLVLSGMFAIVLIMAWFDVFARLKPRVVIVLAGCSISIAAVLCWGILSCSPSVSSALVSLLPMLSFVILPGRGESSHREDEVPADQNPASSDRGIIDIVAAAMPIRTLIGLAITFFIVNALGMLAPSFGEFSSEVSPVTLLAPLGVTAFFIASAFVVRSRIDPSILYKVLMFVFAAIVLLLTFSAGISASLVFYAAIVAEVMMWTVLALLAKKTPVKPHHVFAVGWIAECLGSTLGQTLAPLFAGYPQAFFAVALMLILVAVGFAFSEGSLMLDVGFADKGDLEGMDDRTASEASGDSRSATSAADGAKNETARSGQPQAGKSAEGQAPLPDGTAAQAPASSGDGQADAQERPADAPSALDSFVAAYDISPRERDVLELWLAGRGLKFIENALFISESTVKSHLRSIYRKCDTHSRDEIISLFEQSTR